MMTAKERDEAARAYYAERYEVIVDYPFVTRPTTWIFDHDRADANAQRCRFCRRGLPDDVRFQKNADACPELLGSKTIRTTNECDPCNERFGQGIETHLGNRLNFL